MSIYRITFGGMTNESTNINNGENNSDDEPTEHASRFGPFPDSFPKECIITQG